MLVGCAGMPVFSHGELGDAAMQALEAGTRATEGRHCDGARLVHSNYSSSVESPMLSKNTRVRTFTGSMTTLRIALGAINIRLLKQLYNLVHIQAPDS